MEFEESISTEIVFEESIYTLARSENTVVARYDAHKRRRLEPMAKDQDRSSVDGSSAKMAAKYHQLRHELVDSVAKAMSLDFNSLPLPGPNDPDLTNDQEHLMLRRTFFVAKNNSKGASGHVLPGSNLKLLKSEFYLQMIESSTGVSSADETTSLSSTSTD